MTGISQNQGQTQWIVPAFDLAGNMTSGPKPGSETTRIHMKYDAWNRMTAVYADDGNGDPGDLIITCRYDGLTRRIQKIVEGSPDVTYDYYYNEAWQCLEERKTPAGGSTTVYAQYVWDIRYIDAPVLRWRDSDNDENHTLDETLYYTNDANMNVTALVEPDGDVVERYAYDLLCHTRLAACKVPPAHGPDADPQPVAEKAIIDIYDPAAPLQANISKKK